MPLFDVVAPQLFADRGGLLGRLLSLRPDLAEDHQDGTQLASGQAAQAQQPTYAPSSKPATSAIGSVLDDFFRQSILQPAKDFPGYVHDAIYDPGYFAQGVGASLGGLGPIASELPGAVKGVLGAIGLVRSATRPEADRPLEAVGLGVRDTRTAASPSVGSIGSSSGYSFGPTQSGMPPGLGLAASLASRKSSELLGGLPQPIAPVFPEPPVPPVAPQIPWLSPHASPVAPQTPSMPPSASPVAPRLGPMPSEPNAADQSTSKPDDDLQQALGPEWQRQQSFLENIRNNWSGGGDEEPESESEKDERCRKQKIDAYQRCTAQRRGKNFNMDKCVKGYLDKDCGGNDPNDPENWFPPRSVRRKTGPGSRLHR
jgi:hypothetical protein